MVFLRLVENFVLAETVVNSSAGSRFRVADNCLCNLKKKKKKNFGVIINTCDRDLKMLKNLYFTFDLCQENVFKINFKKYLEFGIFVLINRQQL